MQIKYLVNGEIFKPDSKEDAAYRYMTRWIRRELHSRSYKPQIKKAGQASFSADAGGIYDACAVRRIPARRTNSGGWAEVDKSRLPFAVNEIIT